MEHSGKGSLSQSVQTYSRYETRLLQQIDILRDSSGLFTGDSVGAEVALFLVEEGISVGRDILAIVQQEFRSQDSPLLPSTD
jgi:hypothetical protein